MSGLVGLIALLVLVMAAAAAKWNSLEKPEGDDDLDFLACVEGDSHLTRAVDSHWDRTGVRPVWRGAGFVRPTKKGGAK